MKGICKTCEGYLLCKLVKKDYEKEIKGIAIKAILPYVSIETTKAGKC